MKMVNGKQVPDADIRLIEVALTFLQRPQTTLNGMEAQAFVAACSLLRAIADGSYVLKDPMEVGHGGNVRPSALGSAKPGAATNGGTEPASAVEPAGTE